MSSPAPVPAASWLGRHHGRLLQLWRARVSSDDAQGLGKELGPLCEGLVQSLEATASSDTWAADFGQHLARSHTVPQAVATIHVLEALMFEGEAEAPSAPERKKVLETLHAVRMALAEATQARQQQLEAAAVRSEEHYLVAARAAGFAIWDWDIASQKLHWSSNLEGLLGHSATALADVSAWLEHVHPADRDRVERGLREALAKGSSRWSDAFSFIRKDGSWAGVLGRAWIVHDGKGEPVRVVGGLIDITEQRRLERELELQVRLTRTVSENAASCLFLLDAQGCVTYMNSAAVRVTGQSLEALRNRPFHQLLRVRDPQAGPQAPLVTPGRPLGPLREQELVFVRDDGCSFPIFCSVTPLAGTTVGSSVLEFRDVSELRRSQDELRDAVRVRDEFLSIASHELRTPLTAMRLQIEGMTKGGTAGELAPAVKRRLERAETSIDRMGRLVGDLLDVSRITSGLLSIEPEELDLCELIRATVELFQPAIRSSRSVLTLTLPTQVLGQWDRHRIDHILFNLISNAVKYGQGKPIEVRLEADDDWVELGVEDHGMGISAADQARIFGRFERAVSERHFGGFGLGLWVVAKSLEAMGGQIRVQSEPGRGAKFIVRLPRVPITEKT